ncbi:DM13 domain-containing protein [Arcicella sp. DC2W]|uniref:DM13 domain-containing protein n=1 Tax=Arcicella gelida TaxID=2984195 RepID=A0ABU5S8A9_9BACT|nr:DM13 domain-containing protein [Arcicella sp. DC2W]MEA5404712.1 DM13 domain-containing protein [Arcicella sp. DC2W]
MKQILISFLSVILLSSCVKDIELVPVNNTPSPVIQEGKEEATGMFTNGVHAVSGTVKVISDSKMPDKKYLSFENFKTDEGPDLYIYLAEDTRSSNFTTVVKLDKTGTFVLEIPQEARLDKQQYVLVWCKRFSVLFGSAKLSQ